jgi:hypothetical protein
VRDWQREKKFFDSQKKTAAELHAEMIFRRMRSFEGDKTKPLSKLEFINTEIQWVNQLKLPQK